MNEVPIRLTTEAVSPKLEVGRKMATDTGTESNAASQKAQAHAVEAARAAKEANAQEQARQKQQELEKLAQASKKKENDEEKKVKVVLTEAELITAWEKYVNSYVKGSEARKHATELAGRLIKQGKSPKDITSKGMAE